jgi:hypothetical protein
MYTSAGPDLATVVLGSIATIFFVTPILFEKHGKQLRQQSEFAKYSSRVNLETHILNNNVD